MQTLTELRELARAERLTFGKYLEALAGIESEADADALAALSEQIVPDMGALRAIRGELEELAATGALTPFRYDLARERAQLAAGPNAYRFVDEIRSTGLDEELVCAITTALDGPFSTMP